MSWDNSPATAVDSAWKADVTESAGNSWETPAGDDTFNGISEENTSKHADGPRDGGCRNCGADDHFARDCPEERREGGAGGDHSCYNCGEDGHNKADCPNPRVEREFTGECRTCAQPGHRAADCPLKPADICKICGQEGHLQADCGVNRITHKAETLSLEEAWKQLEEADKEKDVEDIMKAILAYAKAYPETTLPELEAAFREQNMNTHLIAKIQEVSDTHTIINLQGQAEQEFVVSVQFSVKPRRAKFAEDWPASPEENVERLAKAGFVEDGLKTKCRNCDELGHRSKDCTEEKREIEKVKIMCTNCSEEGHRMRDCTQPRKTSGRACKNCGKEGHMAKECEEPPNMDNVECKNCNEMGHFSRECPSRQPDLCRNCGQEGHRKADCTNERVMQCRNCDEWGHSGRECPKPRDWSRVECNNCKEKGHTSSRCKNPPAEVSEEDGDAAGGDAGGDGGW